MTTTMEPETPAPSSGSGDAQPHHRAAPKLITGPIVRQAIGDSILKLNPRQMAKNPVMFVVEVGSVLTTILFFAEAGLGHRRRERLRRRRRRVPLVHGAVRELRRGGGRGTGQGAGRHPAQPPGPTPWPTSATPTARSTTCRPRRSTSTIVVVVSAGELIPSDGEIVEGIATVDESAITGESAPVIRESGGDRSAVTGGTRVLSDEIVVRITARAGETFVDRMIALVEGSERQKTPNEIALNILLAGLTIIFLLATVTLQPFAVYCGAKQSIIVLVALLVCLIPTTIGGLLSAIGIAGMDRLVRRNVLAMSGRAVEAAGDCATLLMDKTGTITYGNRQAAEFRPVAGVTVDELAAASLLSVARRRDARGSLDRGARPSTSSACHADAVPRRRAHPLHRPDPHVGHRRWRTKRSARARPTR